MKLTSLFFFILFSTMAFAEDHGGGHGGGGGGGGEGEEKKKPPISIVEIKWIDRPSDRSKFAFGDIVDSDKGIKIPGKLVAELESFYISEMRRLEPNLNLQRSDKEIRSSLTRRFLRAVTRLDDQGSGALIRNTEYESGRGGMIIDLKDVVAKKRANFRVEFLLSVTGKKGEWIDPASDLIRLNTYFVSNAKKRNLAGDSYGSGCDRFMDLSTYFHSQMNEGGFLVNTTEQRYLSVLGGTFVFATVYKGDLYLASVTMTDSRYKDLMCRDS